MDLLLPTAVSVFAATLLVILLALQRRRYLLIGDAQRRRFFLRVMQAPRRSFSATPTRAAPTRAPARDVSDTGIAGAAPGAVGVLDEGVLYVDTRGHCTFANRAARDLLDWNAGELALSDALAGGQQEADVLLAALTQDGEVERHITTLARRSSEAVAVHAVALRDRDGNLWGAALFLRALPAAPAATAIRSVPSPH